MLTVLLHARPTGNSGIKLNISRSKIQKKRQVRDNSNCGKVKFSQASVILSTGGGLYTSQPDTNPLDRHPLRQTSPRQTPSPGDDHCSGRYASCWNAFSFISCFYSRCTNRQLFSYTDKKPRLLLF